LWASTPAEPRRAFTIRFLHWAEAFMITAHVSLHAFVEAVRYKNGQSQSEVFTIKSFVVVDLSSLFITSAIVP
jgi:hypothetical protein